MPAPEAPEPTAPTAQRGPAEAGASLSRRPWRVFAILAALIIIAVLAWRVDLAATLHTLERVDPLALALAAGIALLDRFVMAWKWNMLLRVRGAALTALGAFRVYLASGFVGYVVPSGLGSDLFRAARLSVSGRALSNVSASILLERVLGLIAVLGLALAGLAVLVGAAGRSDLAPVLWSVAVVFPGVLAATILSLNERLFARLRRATARFSHLRPVRLLYALHAEYVAMSRARATVLAFCLLSVVNQLIQALALVPILLSIGAPVRLLTLCTLLPLTKAVFQLIPVPAGIGIAEGTFVVTLSLAQVPPAQGLAVALVIRAIDLATLFPMGVAYMLDAARLKRQGDLT